MSFEEDRPPERSEAEAFILRLEAYEGPIDLLLEQARAQQVDLARISVLALAEQYLAFIEQARALRIELAADYLVMAAWLAYLKSRLLLPEPAGDPDQPAAETLAAALAFQLRRLEAMREAALRLMARPQLGRDWHARGAPEPVALVRVPHYSASLYDFLAAYAAQKRRERQRDSRLRVEASRLYSTDQALERLTAMLGRFPGWAMLQAFLPPETEDPLVTRSGLASTLTATLELAKTGRIELRQDRPFAPIFLRRKGDNA